MRDAAWAKGDNGETVCARIIDGRLTVANFREGSFSRFSEADMEDIKDCIRYAHIAKGMFHCLWLTRYQSLTDTGLPL